MCATFTREKETKTSRRRLVEGLGLGEDKDEEGEEGEVERKGHNRWTAAVVGTRGAARTEGA